MFFLLNLNILEEKKKILLREEFMTYEEYIKWAQDSIKELSSSLGIPKAFIEKKKQEEQQ